MLRDYHDFIMNLRHNGYNYTQISEELERVHGYKVSRQAITKYINRQEIIKLDVSDMIEKKDLDVVLSSSSGRKAHQYLINNGYSISYHKVLSIRNQANSNS